MSMKQNRGGALLVVLLALALLLSLSVPFLLTGQLRSAAARETFDRASARIAVDSAAEQARWLLADTHPALDPTPWWDSADEWQADGLGPMPQALGGPWANSHESWGVETESAQSLVSLATAPPLLLQNLLHPCFLAADASFEDSSIEVTSTEGFPDSGFIMLAGGWLEYGAKTASSFDEISPAVEPPDDLEATRFREGEAIYDQRIVNLVLARMRYGEQRAPEFLDDLFAFNFGDPNTPLLPEADRRELADYSWLSTGAFGEPEFQPAVYTVGPPPEEMPNFVRVADANAFSPGTMVRIESPAFGFSIDSLVLATGRGGILLPQDLPADLPAWQTRITPFRRDPIDINSCRREILEAMVLGLRFRAPNVIASEPPTGFRRGSYVTASRARNFADAVIAARPVTGPDDLWQRVLEPMLDDGSLSHADAWAIHLNGLDPNNGQLATSTVGFAYRSGDRFLQRVNAAKRSRLGATLARAAANQDLQVAPSIPLLQLWATQRDFEEGGRYARGLHGVVTLPNHRGNLGGHSDGAASNGLTLRVGAHHPTPFAEESEDPEISALMPQPAEDHWQGIRGRVEHFHLEPSPLGWDLGEKGPLIDVLEEFGIQVDDTGGSDDVPLTVQGWFRMPEFGATDGVLFEVSGDFVDRQRIVGAFEEGMLVVRVYDNAGDDPFDEDNLIQAWTVELDPAEYSLENRWFHLAALLRGVRAGGVQVLIDGVPRGETHGFTNLTSAVAAYAPGDNDDAIEVESTEGFPSRGVIRIGDEVIEYSSKTDTSFVTQRVPSAGGYIGGRAAREGSDSEINLRDTSHPEGAGVELYGYSATLSTDIPPGGATLTSEIGPWSIGHAIEGPEEISVFFPIIRQSFFVGYGISGDYVGPITLAPAEAGDTYYADAFQATGGYAVLMQRGFANQDTEGFAIGGFEIVRYSSRQGDVVNIIERNVTTPRSEDLDETFNQDAAANGHSFVTEWADWLTTNEGILFSEDPELRVFLVPISIAGSSVTDVRYLIPNDNHSEFVQITNSSDAGLTEWVRYDSILDGYFLRDDPGALLDAIGTYLFGDEFFDNDFPDDPPGSGGGGGGGGGGGTGGNNGGGSTGPPGGGNAGGGLMKLVQEPEDDNLFTRRIGEPVEDRPRAITDALRRFQFRGVMGTYDHAHQGGEDLVPVFRVRRPPFSTPEGGFVGRLDRVAVIDPTTQEPPFWYTVQWGTPAWPRNENRVLQGHTYVAFDRSTGIPYAIPEVNEDDPSTDPRDYLRMVKFPSGERPLALRSVSVGSSLSGTGGVFGGTVDELVIGQPAGGGGDSFVQRGAFRLEEDLSSTEESSMIVNENIAIVDGRERAAQSSGDFLQSIPSSGLLWIDGELVAYTGVNAGAGTIEIASEGRGLLGTEARNHAAGTRVWPADMRPVSFLQNGLSPTQAEFQLENGLGFGPHTLFLVNEELIHAPTRPGGNAFTMDRFPFDADDPNDLTGRGDGIFRGRFGTTPASHSSGTMVYSFPNRWMDLYAPRQNSQESAYYQIGMEQPNAYWEGVYFEAEEPDASHDVRVLARAGQAQWEDDPESTPGLVLVDRGQQANGGPVPLELNADQLDLRVMFDWTVGAFDPVEFLSTGWTIAPRLRQLRLHYYADSRVVREEEVKE